MKRLPFILFSILFSNFCASQEYVDLVKFDYSTTPLNDFDSADATTSLCEINGDLTLPLVFNENLTFISGVSYEMTSASFNPEREKETMTGLTLKVGANITHKSNWSGTYMLLPKISSDFRTISSNDVQFGAVALLKYRKTEHLNYRIGLYGNNELFGPFIVPIFGLYYLDSTQKFEAKVLLPLSVDLNYSVRKNMRFGINFKGQLRTYNMNKSIGTESDRYLARSTNDLYSYFQYGMKNGINFQLGVGRSVGRSYRVYDEKVSLGIPLHYFDDSRTQLNSDFSDSWFFKFAVFYRLILDKQ